MFIITLVLRVYYAQRKPEIKILLQRKNVNIYFNYCRSMCLRWPVKWVCSNVFVCRTIFFLAAVGFTRTILDKQQRINKRFLIITFYEGTHQPTDPVIHSDSVEKYPRTNIEINLHERRE